MVSSREQPGITPTLELWPKEKGPAKKTLFLIDMNMLSLSNVCILFKYIHWSFLSFFSNAVLQTRMLLYSLLF